MRLLLFALAALAVACGNTYHPEYHPVTLTNYEQHVSYPTGNATTGRLPETVFRPPPPPQPPTPAPWSAWPEQ